MEDRIKVLDDIRLLIYKGITIQVSGTFEGGTATLK